jgi:hypothetical protein
MTKLENLTQGAAVKGILPNQVVTVVNVKWHGSGGGGDYLQGRPVADLRVGS